MMKPKVGRVDLNGLLISRNRVDRLPETIITISLPSVAVGRMRGKRGFSRKIVGPLPQSPTGRLVQHLLRGCLQQGQRRHLIIERALAGLGVDLIKVGPSMMPYKMIRKIKDQDRKINAGTPTQQLTNPFRYLFRGKDINLFSLFF